jgi:hypothetical protein
LVGYGKRWLRRHIFLLDHHSYSLCEMSFS